MNVLSRERSILEREFMEYQPFGIDPAGQKIQDVSGVTVAANVCYLEETIELTQGKEAAVAAVNTLCGLLNRRIRDSAYHVTSGFLKNSWNSYSYEFVCFLGELCQTLSGVPEFQFNVGKK